MREIRGGPSLTSAKARAENGVSAGGFMTTVHPAASAGATFLVIIADGKFFPKVRKR